MPPSKVVETASKNIIYPLGRALKSLATKDNRIRTRTEVVNPELCGINCFLEIGD